MSNIWQQAVDERQAEAEGVPLDEYLSRIRPERERRAARQAEDIRLGQIEIQNIEVARALNRLRVRDQARQLYAAEKSGGLDLPKIIWDLNDIGSGPRSDPLVEGMLDRGCYAILSGRDSTYKSFVGVSLGLSLATGTSWCGRSTSKVKVLYIAAEGSTGLRKRVAAWAYENQINYEPGWFAVIALPVNLFVGGAPFEELLRLIKEHEFGLVIVDTLRRSSGGAMENSSDMGAVVDSIHRIKNSTINGSVLVIAHTGKDDVDTRGFSGIEDDADIVLRTKVKRNVMSLVHTKMKDGPLVDDIRFRPKEVLDSIVLDQIDGSGPYGTDRSDNEVDPKVTELIRTMDTLRIPLTDGRAKVSSALREAGFKAATAAIAQAIRMRKARQAE